MKRIKEDIAQGNYSKCYLLYGTENYLKNQYTENLHKGMCADGDNMNTHFFEGKDISVGEIIDLAETLPFLSQRRVIFIKNSGLFKSNGDQLAEYIPQMSESTVFVFTENEVDKRCKLFKAVAAAGYTTEFGEMDEKSLRIWISKIVKSNNKRIDDNTISLFLSKTGTDMENISRELEKLICYCLDKDIIDIADVEAICTTKVTTHIFDMVEAIAHGQTKSAMELYYELLAAREAPIRILALISKHYNQLYIAKDMKYHGKSQNEIASAIGIRPYFVNKYLNQASHYKLEDLKRALDKCLQADQDIKTGRLNEYLSIEILINEGPTTPVTPQ